MAKYPIKPLDTGHFPDLANPLLTYMHGFGETIRVPIAMWAIEGANQRILVDTGSGNPQRSLEYHRFLEQSEAKRPDQALSSIGWKTEDDGTSYSFYRARGKDDRAGLHSCWVISLMRCCKPCVLGTAYER